jgi:hypothetical protein
MAFPMAEPARAAAASERPTTKRVGPGVWVWAPLALMTIVAVVGVQYYSAPLGERLRHPMHAWLRPSGYIGQTAGLLTFAGFLFMWLFPLRKRFRKVEWLGPVPRWLDTHIAVGIMLPLLGAIHASFRVSGVIGLGYISMLIVCASGFIGRYLYVRIPRSRNGVEMGLSEVNGHQRAMLAEIADATGLTVVDVQEILKVDNGPAHMGILQAFAQMMRDDIARGRAVRRLRARVKARGGSSPESLK